MQRVILDVRLPSCFATGLMIYRRGKIYFVIIQILPHFVT